MLAALAGLAVILAIAGAGGVLYIVYEYGRGLPDYGQLADYEPPTVTRVHAGDGRLLAEYATEKRVFVPMEAIPRRVVNAFLSAEDQNFYDHPGVDPISVLRAVVTNIANFGTNRQIGRAHVCTPVTNAHLVC